MTLSRVLPRALICTAATAALLSGCAASPSSQTPTSSMAEEWDAAAWVPPHPVQRQPSTAQEREESREKQLARIANPTNATPRPAVRWVTPAEFGEIMAKRLAEVGITAEAGDGGVSFPDGIDEPLEPLLDSVTFEVTAEYPIDPEYLRPLNQEQLGLLWDYWTGYFLPCANAHGAPPIQPSPTRQYFVANYYSVFITDPESWLPPDNLMLLMEFSDYQELSKFCPDHPPSKHLYGQ